MKQTIDSILHECEESLERAQRRRETPRESISKDVAGWCLIVLGVCAATWQITSEYPVPLFVFASIIVAACGIGLVVRSVKL